MSVQIISRDIINTIPLTYAWPDTVADDITATVTEAQSEFGFHAAHPDDARLPQQVGLHRDRVPTK